MFLLQGYTATDCSMRDGQPPTITGVQQGGQCDVRARPCRRVHIFALDVMEGAYCGYRHFRVGVVTCAYCHNMAMTYHSITVG